MIPRISLILVALAALTLLSCNGQEQTNASQTVPEDSTDTAEAQRYPVPYPNDSGHYDRLFEIEGQLCQHLREIIEDGHGNLWFGTNIYGVIKFDGEQLEYFDKYAGYDGGRVTGSLVDDDGNVWFAAHGGLYMFDGERFVNYDEKHGLQDTELFGLIEANDGSYWSGSMEGVSRFDGESFTNIDIPNISVEDTTSILSYDRVSCLIQDSHGIFWFGTDGFGICRYDPSLPQEQAFTHLTMKDGLPDNNISSIWEHDDGALWIGTMYGGMCVYDGERFSEFGKDEIEGVEVGGIYEAKDGSLWFPVEHDGLYRFDGDSLINFNKDDGLLTGGVICMYEDSQDRFWVGGWMGLFRYDPETANTRDGKAFFPVTVNGPWE